MVKSYIQFLLNLGTESTDDLKIKNYVRFANMNGLTFFVVDLALAILFYFILDDNYISIGMSVASLSFLIGSIGFNYFNFTTLSRLSTVSIGSILITYCALYLGVESFAAASLLLGAIFPFVYFSLKEKKEIIICIAVPIICYGYFVYNHFIWGPQNKSELSAVVILILQVVSFLVPFAGIVANTHAAISQRDIESQKLLESKKLLETIFYALSHDLASPLTTASMIASLGSNRGVIEKDSVAKLDKNMQKILRIFKNLRSTAQCSFDGKMKLDLSEHSVEFLIKESLTSVQDHVLEKNIRIDYVDQSGCGETCIVKVEKDLFIYQIMTNFLTNAIKFSEHSGVITVGKFIDEKRGVARILIKDWGVGIEAKRLMNLTSWTASTSTAGTSGEAGTGLGVPLAFNFLQVMGGQAEFKSWHKSEAKIGESGTEVWITLPLQNKEQTFSKFEKQSA